MWAWVTVVLAVLPPVLTSHWVSHMQGSLNMQATQHLGTAVQLTCYATELIVVFARLAFSPASFFHGALLQEHQQRQLYE